MLLNSKSTKYGIEMFKYANVFLSTKKLIRRNIEKKNTQFCKTNPFVFLLRTEFQIISFSFQCVIIKKQYYQIT